MGDLGVATAACGRCRDYASCTGPGCSTTSGGGGGATSTTFGVPPATRSSWWRRPRPQELQPLLAPPRPPAPAELAGGVGSGCHSISGSTCSRSYLPSYSASSSSSATADASIAADCEWTFASRRDESPTAIDAAPAAAAGEWRAGFVFLLVSVVLERVAYYSLVGGVALFLTRQPLCWSADEAAAVVAFLSAAAHLFTLPAAVAADLLSSRAAVAAGYAAHVLGFALAVAQAATDGFASAADYDCVTAATCASPANVTPYASCDAGSGRSAAAFLQQTRATLSPPGKLWVYAACTLVAAGTALLRAAVPPLCGHQVRSEGLSTTRNVLAWYYWGANFGALIAYATVTRLQDSIGYMCGFMTPLLLVTLSCLLFFSGSHKYRWRSPNRAAVRNVLGIMQMALSHSGRAICSGTPTRMLGCFEHAKAINGGAYTVTAVEQVKGACRVVFALFLMLPFFAILLRIMSAFWQEGLYMSHLGGEGHAEISQGIMYLGTTVALPLCNMVIYPLAGRHGYRMTMYRRFILGMLICLSCLLTAGIIELIRVDYLSSGSEEVIGHRLYNVSSMSVLWQIPQQFLLGASQACTIVTAMEFTYIASPRSMQCLLMAIFWSVFGFADLINLAVLPNVPYGMPVDFQRSYHLQWFYFMLAAVLCCVAAAVASVGKVVDIGLDMLTVEALRSVPEPMQLPI